MNLLVKSYLSPGEDFLRLDNYISIQRCTGSINTQKDVHLQQSVPSLWAFTERFTQQSTVN